MCVGAVMSCCHSLSDWLTASCFVLPSRNQRFPPFTSPSNDLSRFAPFPFLSSFLFTGAFLFSFSTFVNLYTLHHIIAHLLFRSLLLWLSLLLSSFFLLSFSLTPAIVTLSFPSHTPSLSPGFCRGGSCQEGARIREEEARDAQRKEIGLRWQRAKTPETNTWRKQGRQEGQGFNDYWAWAH